MWHIPFNTGEYIDFGGVITFAVEVWSWKLCQNKDPLVLYAANRGSVNQNIVLHRIVWSSHSSVRCFDALDSMMFWFMELQIAAPKTNGSLNWHNFQDQTSTAKVITPPKNIGKMPQNLLRKLFWKINLIKMMKILICEPLLI